MLEAALLQHIRIRSSCLAGYNHTHASAAASCLEQVWEEWPLEVSLVQDEAHKANHGNAAGGDLQLQEGKSEDGAAEAEMSDEMVLLHCS
jgi:hypothetical protein